MQRFFIGILIFLLLGITTSTYAHQSTFIKRTDVQRYITQLTNEYQFDKNSLEEIFARIQLLPDVIKKIKTPYEDKPWYVYQKHFISANRIQDGVNFWQQHRYTLDKLQAQYGVPKEIIVGIIGVESDYGKHKGKFSVLNALATLAFDYPPREKFFRQELTHFLLLTRQQQLDPFAVSGSYAGAFGLPQFMPSSFRNYAVDFSNDGHIDLENNKLDAMASVANYLYKNGWQRDAAVALPATVKGTHYHQVMKKGRKPQFTLAQLKNYGVSSVAAYPLNEKAIVIKLDNGKNAAFWLGLQNFYAIMRYNPSVNYAMAVYQLGERIKARVG